MLSSKGNGLRVSAVLMGIAEASDSDELDIDAVDVVVAAVVVVGCVDVSISAIFVVVIGICSVTIPVVVGGACVISGSSMLEGFRVAKEDSSEFAIDELKRSDSPSDVDSGDVVVLEMAGNLIGASVVVEGGTGIVNNSKAGLMAVGTVVVKLEVSTVGVLAETALSSPII